MTGSPSTAVSEAHRRLARRLYEECINQGHVERLPELVAEEYVGANGERGPAGFRDTIAGLRHSFPDIQFTIEDLIAEGDRVVVRWTWKGTHQRAFRGLAPSNKLLTNAGIAIYRIKGEKLVQSWLVTDRLGLLQQVGLVSPTLGAPPPPR